MEIKLNVYKGKEVEKTYTATDFKLYTRDVEDILALINVESFQQGVNEEQLATDILGIVAKGFSKFKPIVQNVFDGLTDEEYGRTSIQELGAIIFQIFTYAIGEMFSFAGNSKLKN